MAPTSSGCHAETQRKLGFRVLGIQLKKKTPAMPGFFLII